MKRLDAMMSRSGTYSRSEAKKLITTGKVTVNGITVKDPSTHVDENSVISVAGEAIDCSEFVYILMNKKAGYICSAAEKPSVLELVPQELKRKDLSTVGRLDKDTEGLLILTNDGDFSHRITSPSKSIYKTYYAKVQNRLLPSDTESFAAGIKEGGDSFLPAELTICDEFSAKVRICEGKYHQVKRMFEAIGNKVVYLKRLSVGNLELDESLRDGECRLLTEEEKQAIFS